MKDLTTGSEARLIVGFAIPLLIGNVFQQLYSTVDAIVVGIAVGPEALAAVGVSFPIIFLVISLVMGVAMGAGVAMSQYFGARDHERLRRAMHTNYAVMGISAVVMTVLGVALAGPILRLIGTPDAYYAPARDYLQVYFIGMVFIFGYNTVAGVLRSLGDSRNPLYYLILASIANIGLVCLFVLGFGWGVVGSAWATVIAQGLAFAVSLVHVQRSRHEVLRIRLAELRVDREELKRMVKLGLPSGIQQALVALGFVVMNGIVNPFGTAVMAGFTAAGRLDSFAAMPAMNLSMAIGTFVAQNLGAGKPERVRRGLVASLLMANGIALATTVALWIFPAQMMGWFTTDPAVVAHGVEYLRVVSAFYVVFASMFVLGGLMRGAGAAIFQMAATLVALWVVRIPASWLLAGQYGPTGLWWGIPIGWGVGLAVLVAFYASGRWKNFALTGPKPGLAGTPKP